MRACLHVSTFTYKLYKGKEKIYILMKNFTCLFYQNLFHFDMKYHFSNGILLFISLMPTHYLSQPTRAYDLGDLWPCNCVSKPIKNHVLSCLRQRTSLKIEICLLLNSCVRQFISSKICQKCPGVVMNNSNPSMQVAVAWGVLWVWEFKATRLHSETLS